MCDECERADFTDAELAPYADETSDRYNRIVFGKMLEIVDRRNTPSHEATN